MIQIKKYLIKLIILLMEKKLGEKLIKVAIWIFQIF